MMSENRERLIKMVGRSDLSSGEALMLCQSCAWKYGDVQCKSEKGCSPSGDRDFVPNWIWKLVEFEKSDGSNEYFLEKMTDEFDTEYLQLCEKHGVEVA